MNRRRSWISLGLLGLCMLIGTACAARSATPTPTPTVVPEIDFLDYPSLGVLHEVNIGDTIVKKRTRYTYPAIQLKNELSVGDGVLAPRLTLVPQFLRLMGQDLQWTYYSATTFSVFTGSTGNHLGVGGLKVPHGYSPAKAAEEIRVKAEKAAKERKSNKTNHPKHQRRSSGPAVGIQIWAGMVTQGRHLHVIPEIEDGRITAVDQPSFQQEFIYSGRSSDTLHFIYREFANDLMRPSFTQKVQYDLGEGNTIGFRELRIEVVEASNTKLKCRVRASFPVTAL